MFGVSAPAVGFANFALSGFWVFGFGNLRGLGIHGFRVQFGLVS